MSVLGEEASSLLGREPLALGMRSQERIAPRLLTMYADLTPRGDFHGLAVVVDQTKHMGV